jgi:hypothetical protein
LRLLKFFCFVVGIVVIFPLPITAAHTAQSMTVCDFVKQIDLLSGRIVRVRGTLIMHETGPDGASPDYLIGMCPELKGRMIKLKIEYPDVWFLKKPPVGYRIDKESFLRAQKVVMSTLREGKVKDRYIATIAGQAYAPPPPSAPPPGMHVAREGAYDAGITIEGIYDVRIPVE